MITMAEIEHVTIAIGIVCLIIAIIIGIKEDLF